jgi:alkylhydroperoxidase family enzyme
MRVHGATAGESEERVFAVAAWRETPYFSDAEPVPDAIWDAAAEHFDEAQLGALVIDIGQINLWNRLNVATQQVVGEHGA